MTKFIAAGIKVFILIVSLVIYHSYHTILYQGFVFKLLHSRLVL